jgi:hypothetical protein
MVADQKPLILTSGLSSVMAVLRCNICGEDGIFIDEPDDTGQSDAALIRHGIIWLLIGDDDDAVEKCLAD